MASFSRKAPATHEDPISVVGRAYRKLCTVLLNKTYPFASMGSGLRISHTVELDRDKAHRIKLGNWIRVRHDVRLQILAAPEDRGEALLVLDDAVDIGPHSTISVKNSIHLENEVTLGQSVLIIDHSPAHENVTMPIKHQGVTEGGKIRIEAGCFIAHGCTILCDRGELVIGRNCIVAANSFVTRSFPAYSLIAGNPARMVQQFDPDLGVWVLGGTGTKKVTLTK
jgi:acetyltransferase-like isoleucine patch superfamily enzyme